MNNNKSNPFCPNPFDKKLPDDSSNPFCPNPFDKKLPDDSLKNYSDKGIRDDLFPRFPCVPSMLKTDVYIVMEKSINNIDVSLNNQATRPISVFEDYHQATLNCLNHENRYIVGPLQFHKAIKTPSLKFF